MDRESVEKILKDSGFISHECAGVENTTCFSKESMDSVDVNVNGVSLYVSKANYVRFEVDDWGVCVRLYYEYYYIGCIVKCYNDLSEFSLEED